MNDAPLTPWIRGALVALLVLSGVPLFVLSEYLLERSLWFVIPLAVYVALMVWASKRWLFPGPQRD